MLMAGAVFADTLSAPSLESKVRDWMDENVMTGLSIALVKGDKVVYQQAFGYRDRETREPLDINDIFRIASISKSFSGMSIMQLVEAGKMSLDDDINDILGMDIRNPRYPDIPVTIRMLLSHTSSMNDGGGYRDLTYVDKTKTDINLIRKKAWLPYPPGKGYKYCNRALNIMGVVIEKISGERFDEYVLNHILKPIGADNSGFNLDKLDNSTFTKLYQYSRKRKELVPGGGYLRINEQKLADGTYVLGKDGVYWSPTGGMKMSAPNLAKWMITLKNGGVAPNGNRIISEKGCKTLLTPVIDTTDLGGQYALTIRHETRLVEGKRLVGHTGSAYGLVSCMYFCPEEDWGIVCISSSVRRKNVGGTQQIRIPHFNGLVNLFHDSFVRQKQEK